MCIRWVTSLIIVNNSNNKSIISTTDRLLKAYPWTSTQLSNRDPYSRALALQQHTQLLPPPVGQHHAYALCISYMLCSRPVPFHERHLFCCQTQITKSHDNANHGLNCVAYSVTRSWTLICILLTRPLQFKSRSECTASDVQEQHVHLHGLLSVLLSVLYEYRVKTELVQRILNHLIHFYATARFFSS